VNENGLVFGYQVEAYPNAMRAMVRPEIMMRQEEAGFVFIRFANPWPAQPHPAFFQHMGESQSLSIEAIGTNELKNLRWMARK